jgi:hypothetical protein
VAVKPYLAVALLLLTVSDTAAQRVRTRFDGLRDCERAGTIQFMRHNPQFRRFLIDRAGIEVERYNDRIGSQFVSTIYRGTATYDGPLGIRKVRFICLHPGPGHRAVYVATMD